MQETIRAVAQFGSDHGWLISANFSLSVLLFAWMLRYRRLYLLAAAERESKAALIENLAEGIYTSALDGRQLSANPALVRLNGYANEAELLNAVRDIGTEWYVDPARRKEFRDILDRDGRVANFVSEIHRHKTRERIWISESARLVHDPLSGKPTHYEGSVRDITEDMRRFELEERLDKLTSQVPGGFFQVVSQPDGGFAATYVSSGFLPTVGQSASFDPDDFIRLVHEDDKAGFAESMTAARDRIEPWNHDFRIRTEAGAIRWLSVVATPEATKAGIVWHGYIQDSTERKTRELEISNMAFFDGLTELPNRRMLLDRLPRAIASANRRGSHGALLFIDLDDFKIVNDSYGHDAGDSFLCEISRRLGNSVRKNDLVARIGGDEFIVLLEDVGRDGLTARDTAQSIAEKILAGLRTGIRIGKVHHLVGASIGVVTFDGTEQSADELLKCADLALYDAKGSGKNLINVFDPALLDLQAARYRLVRELHHAITWDRLVLYFQPVLDRDGRIAGGEGLVRWPHPTRGLLAPEDFVILAERSGLLGEMSKLVLSAGIQTLAGWQADRKTSHLTLSLNMSALAFLSPDFTPTLRRLIDNWGVDATKLTLELTEKIMGRDKEAVRRRMEEVKALGVRFSLDDFGSGHSSLGYLKLFPFDEVKINGDFVARLESQDIGRMLVKTILAMAETLELETVAEHVETEKQLEFLHEHGCDRFQGFLFAAPKPNEDFLTLVRGDRHLKVVPDSGLSVTG